jgi:hypothetical protein
MRVLRGQISLCNFLCNADKIGLAGFVWFAVLATCRYLLLLEIAIRFIKKQLHMRAQLYQANCYLQKYAAV